MLQMISSLLFGLLCLIQVQQGFSLDCFKCYSEDYRRCDDTQYTKTCRGASSKCYSLQYNKIIDDEKEENGFKKGCVNENIKNCEDLCKRYTEMGYNSCNVFCCKGDKCNENGFKDLAKRSKKKKRSSTTNDNNGISNSSQNLKHELAIFFYCMIIFVTNFFPLYS